jgi:hypothetical protein
MRHKFLITSIVVWLFALAMATSLDAQEAKPAPPQKRAVFLNHVLVVLDPDTYQAIAESEFLREQLGSSLKTRTVNMDQRSWTATYLYFERTYLEFCEPAGTTDVKRKEGDAGINFSVDRVSDLQLVFDTFKKQPGTDPARKTRHVKSSAGEQVAHSETVVSQESSALPRFNTWVQAYHPDYLKLHKIPIPESGEVTRETMRKLFSERFGYGTNKDALGADVIGVTLALGPEEAQRLDRELAAFGYAKTKEADAVEYAGPDFALRVVPESASKRGYKVISVKIALRKEPKESRELRFGPRCVLRIHKDKTADWIFD